MITTKDLRGDNLLLIFMDFLLIILLAWQPSASFILYPAVAVRLVENNLAACSSHASSPRMNDDHKIARRHSLKQALLLPSLQHDLHFATTTPSSSATKSQFRRKSGTVSTETAEVKLDLRMRDNRSFQLDTLMQQ